MILERKEKPRGYFTSAFATKGETDRYEPTSNIHTSRVQRETLATSPNYRRVVKIPEILWNDESKRRLIVPRNCVAPEIDIARGGSETAPKETGSSRGAAIVLPCRRAIQFVNKVGKRRIAIVHAHITSTMAQRFRCRGEGIAGAACNDCVPRGSEVFPRMTMPRG